MKRRAFLKFAALAGTGGCVLPLLAAEKTVDRAALEAIRDADVLLPRYRAQCLTGRI